MSKCLFETFSHFAYWFCVLHSLASVLTIRIYSGHLVSWRTHSTTGSGFLPNSKTQLEWYRSFTIAGVHNLLKERWVLCRHVVLVKYLPNSLVTLSARLPWWCLIDVCTSWISFSSSVLCFEIELPDLLILPHRGTYYCSMTFKTAFAVGRLIWYRCTSFVNTSYTGSDLQICRLQAELNRRLLYVVFLTKLKLGTKIRNTKVMQTFIWIT